jgi:hypothetical protein
MGLAEEIARVRQRARGAEINARHRRAREQARQITAAMKEATPIDGVNPRFAGALDAAREKAKAAAVARDQPRDPSERIEQLVREGKLPPRVGGLGVGYEPTPEELLGDSAEGVPPDGTEELPDAATLLAGDAPAAPGAWGEAPAPAAVAGSVAGAVAPPSTPALARPAPTVHSKRKRGR